MSGGALTLAAFMSLAGTCAPNVAPETLAAIARAESSLKPLAIGVNGPGGGAVQPATVVEAVARASALITAGRSIDLGIMQINNRNLAWLGLSVADAFDPCRSIAAGAKVLTAFSGYNTGSPTRGFSNGYVQRVVASHVRNAGTSGAVEPTSPVQAAPAQPVPIMPPASSSWDVWAMPAPAPEPATAPPLPAAELEADAADKPRLIVELNSGG